jgi:hypothetical protein
VTSIPMEKAKEAIIQTFPLWPMHERWAFICRLVKTLRNEFAQEIKTQLVESLKPVIGL